MDRLIIITISIFFILSCAADSDQIEYFDNEINRVFPDRNYNDYIVGENKKILEEINDINQYLNTLYEMLKTKAVADNKYFEDKNEFPYGFTTVITKMADYIYEEKNNDKNIILKILIEINNKPDVNYVHNFLYGISKGYYNLLTKIRNDVNQENINTFINSLPTLEMILLSEYITLVNSNQKPDVKAFYNAYISINEQNYEQIFLSKKLFLYTTNKRREFVESISYYFKLREFIE